MTLQWRDGLSVGNDVIDSDHKYLIEIINRVEKSLGRNDRAGLTNSLDSLVHYSKTHFSAEEKIAHAVGYTHVPRLHDAHEKLIDKLDQIRAEIGDEWSSASVEHFTELLRDWLINHVIKEDFLMKPFIVKHSPKFDPR